MRKADADGNKSDLTHRFRRGNGGSMHSREPVCATGEVWVSAEAWQAKDNGKPVRDVDG